MKETTTANKDIFDLSSVLATHLTDAFIIPAALQMHLSKYFLLFQSPAWVAQKMSPRLLRSDPETNSERAFLTMPHDGLNFVVHFVGTLTLKEIADMPEDGTVMLSYRQARPELDFPPTVLIKRYVKGSAEWLTREEK